MPPLPLKRVAKQTLTILKRGTYEHKTGRVDISKEVAAAIDGTRLYRPDMLAELLQAPSPSSSNANIAVTEETTQWAAQRLTQAPGALILLNFASARNAGGGFENGAVAQEEDLCRCSALVLCQRTQPDYYHENKEPSMLYTDHMIYSPAVPFFRVTSHSVLATPFLTSIITAPAPNAGEHLRRQPNDHAGIDRALRRRAGYVLALAKHRGYRRLLLGAWGCGVFRNQPEHVADAFGGWLDDQQFADAFDEVTFAIMARGKAQANLQAFQARFGDGQTAVTEV